MCEHEEKTAPVRAQEVMAMKIQRLRTLLDTLAWPEPYRDTPFVPRGTKVHNGIRQRVKSEIKL